MRQLAYLRIRIEFVDSYILMWEKIKKILQKEGGKCIIMEKGEPIYIVTRFDDCEGRSEGDLTETEKINQDITEWKNKKTAAQSEILSEEELSSKDAKKENASNNQEIKIEDLPF